MGDQGILYSLISRGSTVLCNFQSGAGNFSEVAHSMLPNIPTRTDAKTTYTSHNLMFHVMVENGLIYMCASDPDVGRRQPYAFLTEIKRQFSAAGLVSRAQFAMEHELDGDFGGTLQTQMQKFSRPGGGDQLSTLQAQVDDVTGIMTQNIERVLERGERLDDLMNKTEDLEASSATFKKTARRVSRKMWCKNMKMTVILICVAVVVVVVIIIIILFSTGVLPPKGGGGSSGSSTIKPSTTPALL